MPHTTTAAQDLSTEAVRANLAAMTVEELGHLADALAGTGDPVLRLVFEAGHAAATSA